MTESSSYYEGPLNSPKLQHCSQQVRKWQFCILQQIKKFVQVRMHSFVFNRLIARETIALLRQYHFRFKCFFNRANYWFKEAKDKQRFASIVRFCIKNIKNLFVCSLCLCVCVPSWTEQTSASFNLYKNWHFAKYWHIKQNWII